MNTASMSLEITANSASSASHRKQPHDEYKPLSRDMSVMVLVLRSAGLALHGTCPQGEEAFMEASRRMRNLARRPVPTKVRQLLMSVKALHLYYHSLMPAATALSLNHYIRILDSALQAS